MCLNQHNRFTLFVKAVFNMLPNHKLLIIEDIKKTQVEYAVEINFVVLLNCLTLSSG